MDCTQTDWLSNKEYLEHFRKKVAQQRVPLSGSLDLTHRCNLRCVHCYLGDQRSIRKDSKAELSTAQWMSIMDDLREAGCLHLLITGGEPLLRRDFEEIYRHAKSNGFLVTVFTNGTLVTDSILKIFDDLPPRAVEISLYGATPATYERVTGIRGSYAQCLEGIQGLLDRQINLSLKTILMTLNRHEFYDMENKAKEYGVKFRFDAAIFPCFNNDKGPIRLRVTPEEVIEKEFSDTDRSQKWKDYFDRTKGFAVSDTLYNCGAGVTMFHVDPYGNLQPCLMAIGYKYNLLGGDFLTGWHDVMPLMRRKKAGAAYVCNECEKRTLCGFCPAFSRLENSAEDVYSKYLCAVGQLRFQAVQHTCI